MWNLPGPGLEPVSPALTGRFSSTAPLGKSPHYYFFKSRGLKKSEIIILTIHSSSGRMNEVTPGREGVAFLWTVISVSLHWWSCDLRWHAALNQASVCAWPSSSSRTTLQLARGRVCSWDFVCVSWWKTAAGLSELFILQGMGLRVPPHTPHPSPAPTQATILSWDRLLSLSVGLAIWGKLGANSHNGLETRKVSVVKLQ